MTDAPRSLGGGDVPPPVGGRRSRARLLLGLVAAAWAVTVVAYFAHAAAVLPVLLLVGTASVLRGGRTLLDRLMLAIALLLGLVLPGALVFAVWPWGLHPIPVLGFASSALIVVAFLTGRRPALPRPVLSDLLSLGLSGAMGLLAALPLFGSTQKLLARTMAGEDSARHMDVIAAIGRTGGYLFEHPDAARQHVYNGMVTYPQGSHMLDALLDGFLRSGGSQNVGLGLLTHYVGFVAGWYALFGLSMMWAAQWLLGSRLSLGRRLVLLAFVVAFCVTMEPLAMIVWGYPSELAGLVEAVLLIALLARPVSRVRQQILIVAGLVVALGFTYYLFLPAAVLASLFWLLRRRREVWRHRLFAVAVAVPAGVLAVLPALLGVTVGQQSDAVFISGGPRASRLFVLLLVCLVGAGMVTAAGRLSRVWRGYILGLVSVAVPAGALLMAQTVRGQGGYYTNKSVHLVLVVLVLGVGSLALYLPPPRASARRPIERLTAVLLAAAVLVGFGLIRSGATSSAGNRTNWARVYAAGHYGDAADAQEILRAYRTAPAGPAEVTYFLTDKPFESYLCTLYLGTLEGTSGKLAPGIYNGEGLDSPNRLENMVVTIDGPVRIVAVGDIAFREAQRIKGIFPLRRIDVVRAP